MFRANYQGDIGPHVAKALYGIQKIAKEKGLNFDDVEKWSNKDKAHFLGEGYAIGSADYEQNKDQIDDINTKLYQKSEDIWPLYERTRKWSLDYYAEFYERFYTHFDKLFFESQMAECGKKIVNENVPKVFIKDQDAIIFPGEKYGLHRRVFITKDGNPTYEGKEMCNAFSQYETFPFDLKIHVVANEQTEYFKVVFKALDLIDQGKFEGKQKHVSMGMVHLSDHSTGSGQARKMSSRTGDVLTVDWLIDQVKQKVELMLKEGRIEAENKDALIEEITIGAIKYSVLKVGTGNDVAFDIEKSVALDGDSAPYLQYAYARTQSVLSKLDSSDNIALKLSNKEEEGLARMLARLENVLDEASERLSPNIICEYLFSLAKAFNLFYQKHRIVGSDNQENRKMLVFATGKVLEIGLYNLGIKAPKRM